MEDQIRQESKAKKVIKIVIKLLYQILIIFCALLTAVIILQKISDSNRSIGGYRIFRVITGSMEPEYQVGEVVICKETDPKNISVGEDIVYLGKYGEYNGKIIMHNVVEIENEENGRLTFHAKGLNSSSVEDPKINQDQIYGIVIYKSKLLTILYKLATNIYSVFIIVSILVLNVFLTFKNSKKEKIHKLAEPKEKEDSYQEKEIEIIDEEDNYETDENDESDENETDDEEENEND